MLENNHAHHISLDGAWRFLPPATGDWQEIQVPASWESQGHPFRVDGPFRYQKQVFIPAEWSGQKICLEFGAVSYACKVECNGVFLGEHRGMWTPFSFDLTSSARPGAENRIDIEVYKPGPPGSLYPMRSSLAGFIPDIAGAFGGIWQPVRITAYQAALSNLVVNPDYASHAVQVECEAEVFTSIPDRLEWQVQVFHRGVLVEQTTHPYQPAKPLFARLNFTHIDPWSPESPELYTVRVALSARDTEIAFAIRSTGFRRLSADGDQLLLNGRPYLVRGILGWGWDPKSIAPYVPLEQARAEIREIKSMGFNCLKLCLYIPNPEYYQAADEEGLLLWQEFPMWLPEITPALREQAPLEYAQIAALTRSHPSVALYSLGCELNREVDAGLLDRLNTTVRDQVSDVLLCDNSGSGESYGGLDVDFADFNDYHPYYDIHYFEPLLNHWRRDWLPARPWIFGEFCDLDTFRDLDEINRVNGGNPPWWLTRENPVTDWRSEGQAVLDAARRLAESGLSTPAAELVRISYAQSQLIRKYTLEALRRRAAMGGYIVTGLRDTPISTSGVWDDLGRAKWSAAEYLETNAEDILCIDTDRRRTWRHGGDRPDPIDPYNFTAPGPARWQVILHCSTRDWPIPAQLEWTLTGQQGQVLSSESFNVSQPIPAGRPARIAALGCTLPAFPQPQIMTLALTLRSGDRTVANHWPIWAYPLGSLAPTAVLFDPPGLLANWGDPLSSLPRVTSLNQKAILSSPLVTTAWDSVVIDHFNAGGKVLLLQSGDGPLPTRRLPFWREAIKIPIDHPIWQDFPHQGYTGMQFFAVAGDLAFNTSQLQQALPTGAAFRPVLRRLDAREFHLSEYIFEAESHAGGILLACSLPLSGGAGAQPSGLRRNIAGSALLRAMLRYIN